jgi:hypothetical protein
VRVSGEPISLVARVSRVRPETRALWIAVVFIALACCAFALGSKSAGLVLLIVGGVATIAGQQILFRRNRRR